MTEEEAHLVKIWPDILGMDPEADSAMAEHLVSLGIFYVDPEKRKKALVELLGIIKLAIDSQA